MPIPGPGSSSSGSSRGGGIPGPSSGSSSGTSEGPSQTRQLAQAIAKLKRTNPGKSRLFDKYLKSLPQEDLVAAGLAAPDKGKSKSLWQKAVGGAAALVEPLDRASQATLGLIQNARTNAGTGERFRDLGKALSGHGGGDEPEERLNFRGATGLNFKGPGVNTPLGRLDVGGVVDFVGTTATDPITYATGGVGVFAKAGLGVAARELGEEAATRLASKGLRKGLTKAEQATLKAATTPRVYRALGRRAKGGIGFAAGNRGVTLVKGETIGKVARATRLSDTTTRVTRDLGKASDYWTPQEVASKVGEAKSKAQTKLIDQAMGPAAKAQREARVAGSKAEEAAKKAAEIRVEINQANLDGFPPGYGAGKRLGQAEVAARGARQAAEKAKFQAAKAAAKRDEALRDIPEKLAEVADKKALSLLSKKPLLPEGGLPKVTETVVTKKGLKGGLQRSKVARGIQPRARLTAAFGARMSDEVYRKMSRAIGTHASDLDNVVSDISKAVHAAKMTPDEVKAVRDALDIGGDLSAARASARPEVAALIDKLDEIRQAINADFLALGGQSRYNANEYLLHRLSKEGKEWVVKNESAARRAGIVDNAVASSQELGGSTKQRKIAGSISDINERAPGQFGAPENLFETDPSVLVAKSADNILKAKAEQRLMQDLEGLVLPTGHPAVLSSPKGDAVAARAVKTKADALGYEQIAKDTRDSLTGPAWAPPEIAEELKRARTLLTNDAALEALQDVFNKWQHLWKAYATLPVVGGVSFFSRNAQTNVIQNAIAGYASIRYYTQAFKIQRAIGKVGKVDEGLLQSVGGLTAHEAHIAMEAKRTGVLGSGFGSVENPKRAARLEYKTKAQRAKESIKIWKPNNILTNRGQIINSVVEDNARLAHFVGAYKHLGNVEDAAASVRKYLFDYNDLTAVERQVFKKYIGFYTFMRKNTVAQIQQLMENPGKVSALRRGLQSAGTGDLGGSVPPQYSLDSGGSPLGGPLSSFLTGKKGVPVVGGLDTPLLASAQAVTPLAQLATYVPGLREVLPEGLRPTEGFGGIARDALNIPSGGGVEALKLLVERGTGRDLFTGGKAKTGTKDTLIELASLFAPLASKGGRLVPAAADALGGGDLSAKNRLTLINALIGANAVAVTEDVTASQQRGAKIRVEAALKALRDSGVKVPTWDELKDAGVVPSGKGRLRR